MSVPKDLSSFRKEALAAHNTYRKTHNAPALVESMELTKQAQDWAEHLAKKGLFQHSSNSGTGENLAMRYSSGSTSFEGNEATDMWYNEVKKYDFSKGGFQSGTGHFTQVVWKETKEFGIGKAITDEGKVIVVANYKPPGNMMSKFQENVLKGSYGS